MFTGIIHTLGEVISRKNGANEARFAIHPRVSFTAPEAGESVSVNGVCLTAESFNGTVFTAYASEETFTHSTLQNLQKGGTVNLEQAVVIGTRLGGHMVSGHVDCVAKVAAVVARGASTVFRLEFPRPMGHLVVPKGSVALDGVSLTINECGLDFLTVNIIPETIRATTINQWRIGSLVNMETDLIGKYVARMVETGYVPAGNDAGEKPGLTMDFLQEHGF